MALPRLNYDDFYKFLTSFGIVLIALSVIIPIISLNNIITYIFSPVLIILGSFLFIFGILKWYKNQQIKNRLLENRFRLSNSSVEEQTAKNTNTPNIEYRIDSSLPGTTKLDLLKDGNVWFMVKNNDDKKYRIYFKISLYLNDNKVYVYDKSYYGGEKAWNLNPNIMIKAPGLHIPQQILENLKKKQKFEIRIDCEIKDEKDKLIERRLPVGYVYTYDTNSWYFEP